MIVLSIIHVSWLTQSIMQELEMAYTNNNQKKKTIKSSKLEKFHLSTITTKTPVFCLLWI